MAESERGGGQQAAEGRRLETQLRGLRVLVRLTNLAHDRELPLPLLLRHLVEQLPQAYQYPAIACARAELGELVAQSANYRKTEWEQTAGVGTLFSVTGRLTVCYLEARPEEAEGPFLEEERELLNAVAGLLGERAEREQIEEALRRREQHLATVLAATPIILWNLDRGGTISLLQGERLQRYGLDPERIVGSHYSALRPLSGELTEAFRRALAGEQAMEDLSLNGRVLQSRFLPLLGEGSQGAIGVQMDVTQRKQAERELERTNRLLEEVFAGTHFLIAYLDRDLRYLRVNQAYARAAGRDPDSFSGRSHFEMFSDPQLFPVFRRVLERGEPHSAHDVFLPYLSGIQGSNWDLDLLPFGGGGALGLAFILIDRSRRKQALQELEKSQAELKRLASHLQDMREDERRRIARELHDELGGLLTAIKMDVALARRGRTSGPQETSQLLGRAEAVVDQSIGLIRRIVGDLRPQILDDLGLVPALEWLVAEFRQRTGVSCRLEAAAEEPPIPKEVATALFRIVQEALTNIARHAGAGRVGVALRRAGGALSVEVTDDGRGISGEQAADPGSFGLAGIRERAAHFGGRADIRGQAGRGTTVYVEIPCCGS